MKKGLTLIEILVVVGVFLILVFASFLVMGTGRSSWFTADTSAKLRQEVMRAFMVMERDLKQTRPAWIDLTTGNTSATLNFNIPRDIDGNGTVLDAFGAVEPSPQITYALVGNQITRTISGVTTVIANDIFSLQFTRPVTPLNIIQVDITARRISGARRTMQETGQIIVKMRN